MPPKSTTLDFFHLGPRPSAVGVGGSRNSPTTHGCSSSSALSLLGPPSDHVSVSQFPLRERILGQRDTRLFVDHKQRVMQIAFESSHGVSVETMEFTLFCPYSQTRISIPVRSDSCVHVQCCDIDSWVSLFAKFKAMRDPGAPCPVCDNRVLLSSLRVDEWMVTVLRNVPTKMVILDRSGAYRSGEASRVAKRLREEVEILVTQATPPTDDDDANDCETYDGPGAGHLGDMPPAVKVEPRHSVDRYAQDGGDEADEGPLSSTSPAVVGGASVLGALSTTMGKGRASNDLPVAAGGADIKPAYDGGTTPTAVPLSAKRSAPQPAGWRKWQSYCPACLVHCVASSASGANSMDNCSGVQYDGDDAVYGCPVCHAKRRRLDWPAMRIFLGAAGDTAGGSSSTSLEITEDGTVVLRGVDTMSKYLFKAGFSRTSLAMVRAEWRRAATQYDPAGAQSACVVETDDVSLDSATSVWFTSSAVSKLELDFLETMCDEIARGNDPYEFVGFAPALFKFRYDKSSRDRGVFFTQGGSSQPLQAQNTPPPTAAMVTSPPAADMTATVASPFSTRTGSFRIQFGPR